MKKETESSYIKCILPFKLGQCLPHYILKHRQVFHMNDVGRFFITFLIF